MIAVAEFDSGPARTGRAHKPQHPLDRPVTLDPNGNVLDRNGRRNRQAIFAVCGRKIYYGFPFVLDPFDGNACGHCFPPTAA